VKIRKLVEKLHKVSKEIYNLERELIVD
jgi:hypothetical protein